MTEQEKQLLLKDLCARLPYGVKVQNIISKDVYNLTKMMYCLPTALVTNFKPYLRPMSSMTEEEKDFYDSMFIEVEGDYFGMFPTAIIDWLNAHHFDYRGLIEKGLALKATEGMYKK